MSFVPTKVADLISKRTISSQQGDGGFPLWDCLGLFFLCGNTSTLRTEPYPSVLFWIKVVSLMMDSILTIHHQDLVGIFLAFFDELQDSSPHLGVTWIAKTANKQKAFEVVVRNRLKIRIYAADVVHPGLIISPNYGEAVVAFPKFWTSLAK